MICYVINLNELSSSITLRYIKNIYYETRPKIKCKTKTHFYFIQKQKCSCYLMIENWIDVCKIIDDLLMIYIGIYHFELSWPLVEIL